MSSTLLNTKVACRLPLSQLPQLPAGLKSYWCLLANAGQHPCQHCGEVLPYYTAADDADLISEHLPLVILATVEESCDDLVYVRCPGDLPSDTLVYVPEHEYRWWEHVTSEED